MIANDIDLPPLDPWRRPTVDVETAGAYLNLSRAGAYKWARDGQLPTVGSKGRYTLRVPTAKLMEMLGPPIPPRPDSIEPTP